MRERLILLLKILTGAAIGADVAWADEQPLSIELPPPAT